jgi:hypothetical protein
MEAKEWFQSTGLFLSNFLPARLPSIPHAAKTDSNAIEAGSGTAADKASGADEPCNNQFAAVQ